MSKIKLSTAVAVLSLLTFSQSSMAREFADIYSECGLGAIIAPRNEGVAAVTNVTWDSGTTAISSNVTTPESCQGGQEKTASFIHDSYQHLEKDLANGNGKYLDTLIALSGCNAETRPALAQALRSDFAQSVSAPGYSHQNRFEQANGLYDLLYKRIDTDFSGACNVS